MPNRHLDEFTSAMFWKLVPWLVLGGGSGILAGVFVKWLERRATEIGRKRHARRAAEKKDGSP